jgi:malate dehydrogenase (oxaloacetate-decarboxylating)(NADP+)
MKVQQTGAALLSNSVLTKSTAYSEAERACLGLTGLLPPVPATLDNQVKAMMEVYRSFSTPMQQSLFLDSLRAANETLFFKLLMDNVDELLPVAYTPTVGDYCKQFSHIFRFPRGMFLSIEDKGHLREILDNAQDEVDMIVVTDGERILGLGDLGINGHGIPVGKLVFYTVCAGVDPAKCLGITLDVGTNRKEYLEDPLYLGHRHERVRGAEYDAFIDEFFTAVKDKWPNCAVQFEDFANCNAFRLLDKYQNRYACFSDDIQGTASAVVAGFMSTARAKKCRISDERILFLGAGESGTGAARLLVEAMAEEGTPRQEAFKRIFLYDINGAISTRRTDLPEHHFDFAKDIDPALSFEQVVDLVKPTAIVGLSTCGGAFAESIIRKMASYNERPIIFALSNPNSHSECSAEQAYRWTDGRALFCCGSPFAPVVHQGKTFVPRQGNNYFIFPGIGLGALLSGATAIPPKVFLIASHAVADFVTDEDLAQGSLFPPSGVMREISVKIAAAVIRNAVANGRAQVTAFPEDLEQYVRGTMYEPKYKSFRESMS